MFLEKSAVEKKDKDSENMHDLGKRNKDKDKDNKGEERRKEDNSVCITEATEAAQALQASLRWLRKQQGKFLVIVW